MTSPLSKSTEPSGNKPPKRALGRGLSALIPSAPVSSAAAPEKSEPPVSDQGLRHIPLLKIALNPYQPRDTVAPEQLDELTDSIRQYGVLQPIVVRPKSSGGYELVAGERRFRAATRAGLKEIPAVVRDMDERGSMAVALIENIQRQELNPAETARAYRRLLDEFSLTQTELAQEVGKSQSSIANAMRLLGLPEQVLDSLARGEITEGHGKAILSLETDAERVSVWSEISAKGLNVREAEKLVSLRKNNIPRGIKAATLAASPNTDIDHEQLQLEEQLSTMLGTKVKLAFKGKDKGQIEIAFYGLDQLDGLIQKLAESK